MSHYDHSMAEIPVSVEFRLHEAMALGVLYQRAAPTTDLEDGGYWWGDSVDLAVLRLMENVAKVLGNKEMLLEAGAARAWLDQKR